MTVVVDPNQLGGDDVTGCVDPGTAASAFADAGVRLEFVPTIPGFVCRVDGLPRGGRCTDGDSYWSLWWSDGEDDWTYATLGVNALEVPAGGYVGFAWHQGAGDAAPPDEVAPGDRVRAVEPKTVGERRSDDGGVPLWAAGGLVLVVLGAAVAVPVLRRRPS